MIKLNKMVKKDKKIYMNPTWGIYVLHSLHGQFSGCHFLICVLKELTSSNSFNVHISFGHVCFLHAFI